MTGLDLETLLRLLRADLGTWASLAAIAVVLGLMTWTSWGKRRALRKCLVLSIAVHIGLLSLVGRLLRTPLFFFAIGAQGNIGAAASAPVVAAAFHPTLAPVGVLLGTVGYATGTGLAYVTGLILKWMANG